MRISKWYWVILGVWAITGLPIIYIGIGFAGPDLFTIEGLLSVFTPGFESFSGFFSWLIAFVIAFSPLLFLPLAVKFGRQPDE